jgi:hypothetical protein
MMTLKAFLIILFFLICYSAQGVSMPIFSHPPEEVVVFSPMQGQITHHGKPVANAKISRWLKWKDPEGETEIFYTDENGYFDLPIKTDVVTLGKFSTFVMAQKISVHFEGTTYDIWVTGKRSKIKYGELAGRPVNFRCELISEERPIRLKEGLLLTQCEWDDIEEIDGVDK